jgi:hypothetical protein
MGLRAMILARRLDRRVTSSPGGDPVATWEMSVKPLRFSELAMRFATATALLGVAGLTVVAAAQTPPATPAIARTVVAGTKLPSVTATPTTNRAGW